MNYISTTDLRTKSSELVSELKNGGKVSLIHRSRVIGEIVPKKDEPKTFTKATIAKLEKLARELNLPKTTYAQREKIYRAHLMKKYGKGLS